ncbi:MAG: hypothetical protein ACP5QY_15460, partial [Candidatus Hydrogenedens sp.]
MKNKRFFSLILTLFNIFNKEIIGEKKIAISIIYYRINGVLKKTLLTLLHKFVKNFLSIGQNFFIYQSLNT